MKRIVFSIMLLIVAMSSCNDELVSKSLIVKEPSSGSISLSFAHGEKIYGVQFDIEGEIPDNINIAKSVELTDWNLIFNRESDSKVRIIMYSTDFATTLPEGEIITFTPFSRKIAVTNILASDEKMRLVEF